MYIFSLLGCRMKSKLSLATVAVTFFGLGIYPNSASATCVGTSGTSLSCGDVGDFEASITQWHNALFPIAASHLQALFQSALTAGYDVSQFFAGYAVGDQWGVMSSRESDGSYIHRAMDANYVSTYAQVWDGGDRVVLEATNDYTYTASSFVMGGTSSDDIAPTSHQFAIRDFSFLVGDIVATTVGNLITYTGSTYGSTRAWGTYCTEFSCNNDFMHEIPYDQKFVLGTQQITAVPGPEAGAGLGALAMLGIAYWAKRRRDEKEMVA